MANLIVETSYSQPLDDATHDRLAAQLDPCLEAYGARWLRSYLSTDRLRMVCEFEAPDAEMVRMSYRSAGIDFERVWTAEVYARSA
ncbi:MAG: nickel-binding protein [Acidobacteriota bacterium]